MKHTRTGRRASAALLLAALGCSEEERLASYSGASAYPNRRTNYAGMEQRLGLVSNSLSDSISILDLEAMTEIARVPVGRDPIDLDGPHHLAVDRDRDLLYVALSYPVENIVLGPHAQHGLSRRAGYLQVLDLWDLRPLAELRLDQNPGDVVLSNDGELAITHFDLLRAEQQTELEARRANLVLVDPAAGLLQDAAEVRRIALCITPHAIQYDRARPLLYVSCTGEDNVAVVDVGSGEVVARVDVAASVGKPGAPQHEPYALVLNETGTELLVSNTASRTLSVLQTGDALTRTLTTSVLGAPYFGAYLSDHSALVPMQAPSGLARIDTLSGELSLDTTFSEEVCQNPHEARVTRDGQAFVVCEGDHRSNGSIVRIDPETLEVLAAVEVGVYPDRLIVLDP